MNVFRLLGDLSHLLAIIILLLKIWKTRSCAGKLLKSEKFFRGDFSELCKSTSAEGLLIAGCLKLHAARLLLTLLRDTIRHRIMIRPKFSVFPLMIRNPCLESQ